MKYHRLLLLITFISSTSLACGVHNDTGFNFVTEPGSLDVFGKVVEIRQSNLLSNADKLDYLKRISFNTALNKPAPDKISFNLFEAIKGHYSEVLINNTIAIEARHKQPDETNLLVITEVDILDALATNELSWQQAKTLGLVTVNGLKDEVETLDIWFNHMFPEPDTL
ncbi:hypothetical protein [Shewanella donghaensis]|uniref:hypothetical protein n=1 Tax=Shewanella donghaensis TaxID=238836 RepID=UPI001182F279|nr:hypothetical protein [Shewanella donghaensis]